MDENYFTLGGRLTHPAAIYQTKDGNSLLCFAIAHHAVSPRSHGAQDSSDRSHTHQPLYMEVKLLPGPHTDLQDRVHRLCKGRKVVVHGKLQVRNWHDRHGVAHQSLQVFGREEDMTFGPLPKSDEGQTTETGAP